MSENQENICVINAQNGIGTASPQISQFTHNCECIKFIIDKNLSACSVVVITSKDRMVSVVAEGEALTKSYDSQSGETTLLWYPQTEITCMSGCVVYQIAAYSASDESDFVWYSKEGRLIVSDSIDTTDYSTALIGSSPNLLTQIVTALKSMELDTQNLFENKVDKVSGKGLSTNDFTDENKQSLETLLSDNQINIHSISQNAENIRILDEDFNKYKESVHPGEETYDAQSELAQSGKAVAQAIASFVDSAPETLDTLSELAKALGNDPNFATTIMSLLGEKYGKAEGESLRKSVEELWDESSYLHDAYITLDSKADVLSLEKVDKSAIVTDYEDWLQNSPLDDADTKVPSIGTYSDFYEDVMAHNLRDDSDLSEDIAEDIADGEDFSIYRKVPTITAVRDYVRPVPITEPPITLEANKQYNFGFITTLSLSFPTIANDGDVIYITFFVEGGANSPLNLIIDTTNTNDIEIIPEESTGYEIFAKYNGQASNFGVDNHWIVNYSEYTMGGE